MRCYKYLFLLLVLVSSTLFANNFKPFFDVHVASKQLTSITNKLLNPTTDAHKLRKNVQQVEELRAKAVTCVEKSMEEIKTLENILSTIQDKSLLAKQQTDFNYLQDKKNFYTKQLYECRLYAYRAKETGITIKNNLQSVNTHQLLQRSLPVWQLFHKDLFKAISKIDIHTFNTRSGITQLNQSQIIVWMALMLVGLAITFYIRKLCGLWLKNHTYAGSFVSALLAVIRAMIIPITILGVSSTVLEASYANLLYNPILEDVFDLSLTFILFFSVVKYLFYPAKAINSPLNIPTDLAKTIYLRLTLFLCWVLLGYIVDAVTVNQIITPMLIELAETIYISLFIVILVWTCWAFYRLPLLLQFYPRVILILKIVSSLLLLSLLLIEWLGFHALAIYLLTALSLSLGLIIVSVGLWSLVAKCYQIISQPSFSLARKIHTFFGVKFHKSIQEFVLLKYVAYLLILTLAVISLMQIWRVSAVSIDNFIEHLVSGFEFSGYKVQPLHIVLGVVVFSVLLLFGRFLATLTAKRYHAAGEADAQIAVASIIVYIAFSIALLFALVIMGVNFTGLAIIAGALSVGIGLGLQNIVNNFVSGVILLIEKPIKPGDRVVVGETEGFVKKIRLRSTQIATLAKEDVIIPNSDLITHQVTNYMFRDRLCRIVCPVGVAYGSDVELVRKVLLDIAAVNSSVIQDAPNEPAVLFRNFGESSLLFELWCIIDDVNKKYKVVSELNFEIDKAFREHHITIAFPQRDVHIKS